MLPLMEQDILYWRIVYDLVINKGYRVIRMSETGEVWIESSERRNGKIIRLLRYDIDWGNWLLRDMEETEIEMKRMRKQAYRSKMKAYNIYISTYPPVDDWEHQVAAGATENMETILIELGNRKQQLMRLVELLDLPNLDIDMWIDGNEDLASLIHAIRNLEKMRIEEEKSLLFARKPFFTYVFIAVNLLMFLLLERFGSSTDTFTLIKFGAKYNPAILEGEWWRFISPIFLHIGFLHLFMNTIALYYLGTAVERIYGTYRFFFIYFISGILGVIASFAFNTQVSAGASGAIFGCFGALLYFGVVHPSLFFRTMGMNVFAVLGINLSFGFFVPMIDNGAHIGGLIGGFLASALVHLPKHTFNVRQLASFLALCIVSGSVLGYGLFYGDRSQDALVIGHTAHQLIESGDLEGANMLLSKLIEEQDDVPSELFFLLSYTEIKLGNLDEAARHLEHVVKEKEGFHEAYYNLALIYVDLGEYDKARVAIEQALAIKPDEKNYQTLYKQLELLK